MCHKCGSAPPLFPPEPISVALLRRLRRLHRWLLELLERLLREIGRT